MSALWTSAEIAQAVRGVASQPFDVTGVAFDSREVGPGDLFVALKGEATDGHRFIDQAIAQGAAGILSSDDIAHPHVLVKDTLAALRLMATAARKRSGAKIIGVTGSVGKTGTKEALFQALDRHAPGQTHRSLKSYNNHVGVPLSMARMPRDTRFAIFEMGMNHSGELSALTRLVVPDVAIVTAIAPAHIEFFGTEEAIAEAKAEIFEGLAKGGTAIVPFDSPHVSRLYNRAERYAARVWTFGRGVGADVRATEAVPVPGRGTLVTAKLPGAELCFTISAAGDHWVSNAMAVLAAVEAVGGDLAQAGLALSELPQLAGRGARTMVPAKGGEALLIDESYNANPLSMAATIGQLGKEKAARRIVVLGAMKELGDQGAALHVGLAGPLNDAAVDRIILVGEEMTPLADALAGGQADVVHVDSVDRARAALTADLCGGDAVLVKGSNSVGLSRLVAALTPATEEVN